MSVAIPASKTTPAPPTRSSWGPTWFRVGALLNWIVTVPAIVAPEWSNRMVLDLPNDIHHVFLLRIWAGTAFLWGWFFWEIARGLDQHKPMIKYAWLEKSITALSVTVAWYAGQFVVDGVGHDRVLWMVVVTDWIWIPIFLYYDLRTKGNPLPASILAQARRDLGLGQRPASGSETH